MTNRKFFAIVVFMLLLFASVFSAGCGGGGSGGSDNNVGVTSDDKTQENPTPTPPEPEPDPENLLTVTFDSNGGSTVTSQKVEEGATVNQPDDPTKDGNIFAGWYTDNNEFKNMFLFGASGDVVTEDITLYAQWIEDNPDLYRVQFAVSQIVIGYDGGDNSQHVTKNLTLPTNIEGLENLTVTWTSNNPGVILSDGTVARPQNDTDVTLTATVTSGSEFESREFNVTVIHKNTRNKTDIPNNTVADIEEMNVSNDEFYIGYNDDKTQVINIEGIYSDIVIENAEDALDAIQSIHSILGINDPYNELENSVTTSDTYGGEYTFNQVYNGVKVFGRSITVSANDSGDGDFLHSSLLATDILKSANLNKILTAEQAEQAAVNYCKDYGTDGDFSVVSNDTETVIYSLENFKTTPVTSYIVHVIGACTVSEDEYYVDCNLFVNAVNGDIIDGTVNSSNVTVTRNNEKGERVNFEAHLDTSDNKFCMYDPETKVAIFSDYGFGGYSVPGSIFFLDYPLVKSDNASELGDGQQVSAFENMTEIIKWWRKSFDRNSLNDNGMQVTVITHAQDLTLDKKYIAIIPMRDNAAWMANDEFIKIYDIGGMFGRKFDYSCAVALDALTHETTHAVIQYSAGYEFATHYKNAPGAINEGYADIFGCIIEKNWKIGESLYKNPNKCLRNIKQPDDSNAARKGPDKISSSLYFDYTSLAAKLDFLGLLTDHGGVHTNSLLISHAAYLMHEDNNPENGLTWETLGQLWYKSMRFGYDKTTEFKDVRRAVVNTARKMNLPQAQLDVIKNAFDEVEIEGASGKISGKITAYDSGVAVSGASVKAILNAPLPLNADKDTTDSLGEYSLSLPYTRYKYLIDITASGYVDFLAIQTVEEDVDKKMDVALVKSGKGSELITVRSAIDNAPLNGVVLNLMKGWNTRPANNLLIRSGDVTDENGQFTFENINTGYYTVEMISDDYSPSYVNITVAPNKTISQNGYLSPLLNGSQYRVVLSWGANPGDLDSHLTGKHPDGSSAHVYFGNKSGSVNGKAINLDRDDRDGYGPETTTFEVDTESNYEFYVYWFGGAGTWQSSQAVVNVYNGGRHVAVFTVPEVNSASPRYWSVFKITRGIFAPVNELVSNEPNP